MLGSAMQQACTPTSLTTLVPTPLCPLCCAVQATAAGVKEVEAINLLEKKYKSGPQYSQKEAVELAISTLQVRVAIQAVQAVAR